MKKYVVILLLVWSGYHHAMENQPTITVGNLAAAHKSGEEIALEKKYLFDPLIADQKLTPLQEKFLYAAFSHNLPDLEEALKQNVAINVTTGGGSALHFAMQGDSLHYPLLMRLLKEENINANYFNGSGQMPMDYLLAYLQCSYTPAEEQDFYQLFKAMLEKKAAIVDYEKALVILAKNIPSREYLRCFLISGIKMIP